MKKWWLSLGLCLACTCILWAQTGLFFSEYIEGSSNNKALEIYNPTNDTVDLAAQNYVVMVYSNGSTDAGTAMKLYGLLAPEKTFVFAHNLFALNVPIGTIQQRDTTTSLNWYNGDDAVVLRKGGATGEILDVIGQIGFRPTNPSAWENGEVSTLDKTLIRKTSISAGDKDGSNVYDPATEWTVAPQNQVSDLGKHTSVATNYLIQPNSLSFVATATGIPSASKSILVVNNDTIMRIQIIAPTHFQISPDSLANFTTDFDSVFTPYETEDLKLYVRYVPTSGAVHAETFYTHIKKLRGLDTTTTIIELSVSGQVVSATTPISQVQGKAKESPLKGQVVTTEGVVIKDLQKAEEQKGFFIQSLTPDGDTLSSEGIFVWDNMSNVSVNKGDVVRVTGTVDENFGQTVLKTIISVTVLSSNAKLPMPVLVKLPLDSVEAYEHMEGMVVRFTKLAVTEVYNLGRYGEVLLASEAPLQQPTNLVDLNDVNPQGTTFSGQSNLAAVTALQAANNNRKILLADDFSVESPSPVPFIDPIQKTLRVGTKIDTLEGVLGYEFGTYRVYALDTVKFEYDPRPAAPEILGSNVTIASFNVLNFFNGDGFGGGFPTPRGALTPFEFNRQKAKIVAALKGLNADIVGLMEMENDGDGANSAIKNLVDSLNTTLTIPNKYDYIRDPAGTNGNPGTDQIKVSMIYKSARVAPVGLAKSKNSASFINLGRPPLAQTFDLNGNGERLTVVVNHFKSKGCTDATGLDLDLFDGQSCFNDVRKKQANELLEFVDELIVSSGDSDVVTIGDFNAYGEEDPLDVLRANGLMELSKGYSYVFDGQLGSLDHFFASKSLANQLIGAMEWHINSVEPRIIDYTTSSKTQDLYVPNAYRSSDHDPVIAGFQLQSIVAGFERIEKSEAWHIYPNPIRRGEVLKFTLPAKSSLHDALGNRVVQAKTLGEISTEGLSLGLYTLFIEGEKPVKVLVIE